MPILAPEGSYSFSNYFEQNIDAIDLVEYFGYQLRRSRLELPHSDKAITRLPQLIEDISESLAFLVSSNEPAKREMYVAPIVKEVARQTKALVRIEYPVKVNRQLQGSLDYLLSIDNLKALLVLEAKRDDLDYGFTQLCAELIALDQWERAPSIEDQPTMLGAVTTGITWQFGLLDRRTKQIHQDLRLYNSPDQVEAIVRILIQALS